MADDVMADVFALAWRRLDKAPGDELSWLLGIARGVLANRRRCDARQQALRDRLAANAVPAIPGTHRTALEWRCRRNVKALAK